MGNHVSGNAKVGVQVGSANSVRVSSGQRVQIDGREVCTCSGSRTRTIHPSGAPDTCVRCERQFA